MIRRCPYCKSIWVCWNWFCAFDGDRKSYEKANSHIPSHELMDWVHECWDCGNVLETHRKVKNGIPYWILTRFYSPWKRLIRRYHA